MNIDRRKRKFSSVDILVKTEALKIPPQLLDDCIRGDRKAQFQLYKSCYALLMGVCIRYKKNEADASAVLNAGFLKILKGLKSYKPEVPFEAWARRIIINTIIDEFRKDRKVKELIDYVDMSGPDTYDIAFDYNQADKRFDAAALESLIKQLPPVSQQVFNLYAIDGYKHREIAKMLGISEGTSKWHLSFARKKLMEWMNKAMNSSKVI